MRFRQITSKNYYIMNIRKILVLLVITLSWSHNLSAQKLKAGDEFVAKSVEGIEMVFTVLDATKKTCQVGIIPDYDNNKQPGAQSTFVNGCNGELTIPSTTSNGYRVVKIGKQAFVRAEEMTSVYIPYTVTSLGFLDEEYYGQVNEFYDCSKLSKIDVDAANSVFTSMNSNIIVEKKTKTLLVGCNGSRTDIPVGIEKIAGGAFSHTKIQSISLPNTVKEIDDHAFNTCPNLHSVILNDGLKRIGSNAFIDCEKLGGITLPSSLEEIGPSAFRGSENLTVIKCKMNPPIAINKNTFDKKTFQNGQLNVPNAALEKYMTADGWKDFTMFYGYTPDQEDNVFLYKYADYTEETFFIEGTTKLITGSFEIPESVSVNGKTISVVGIGDGAFSGQIYIEGVKIPNSIQSISNNAFIGCIGLHNVRVGWKIPLEISTKKARTRANDDEDTEEFLEGINKDSCILYVPDESVELYKQADGWKEFKNILPESGYTSIHQAWKIIRAPNVYNLMGRKVRSEFGSLDDLPKGVYIINGKKVIK